MVNIYFPIFFILFSFQFQFVHGDDDKVYHYNITGHLECVHHEGEPSKAPEVGSPVHLYDYDGFPVSHDLLGTAHTDKDGNFVLIGQEQGDWGPPEPYLYARCGDEWFYCCVYTDRVEQSVKMQNRLCTIVGEIGNTMISRNMINDVFFYDCKMLAYWPSYDAAWGRKR